MIKDEEFRSEWEQDMLDEARQDEMHEYNMRADYDNFLEYYENEVLALQKAYKTLSDLHETYGWEMDLGEIL